MFHCFHCDFSARQFFVNKALYFDFSPFNMRLERLNNLPLNPLLPFLCFSVQPPRSLKEFPFRKSKRNGKPFCFFSAARR